MDIIFTLKAENILIELIRALDEAYLSTHSKSLEYVDRLQVELRDQIKLIDILTPPKAGVKYQTKKYGYPTNVIKYKANHATTWYILIRIYKNEAFITYIYNNNDKIHSIAKVRK